nr:MAG TPA: hypothetical protein [Caudoviricetes sp.]
MQTSNLFIDQVSNNRRKLYDIKNQTKLLYRSN